MSMSCVYAHREDVPDHDRFLSWLEQLINGDDAYALADLVLSGFIRIVTHPRVFSPPSRLDDALSFVAALRGRPNYVNVAPGPRHLDVFTSLCRRADAQGSLVPDAYLAALAIESGCEWITTNHALPRSPGLRWRHAPDNAGRAPARANLGPWRPGNPTTVKSGKPIPASTSAPSSATTADASTFASTSLSLPASRSASMVAATEAAVNSQCPMIK